jgi:hypothetical protein
MTTDLETRLRHYGTTLDRAADDDFNDVDVIPIDAALPRARYRLLVPALGLVAALIATLTWFETQRDSNTEEQTTASSPGVTEPDIWNLQLEPGLVPFYEANDPITAALGEPHYGPAAFALRCTEWTASDHTINCLGLGGNGYLPAVAYSGTGGRSGGVIISTLHSDIDAATYGANYSLIEDVEHDAPIPQQDVTIDGKTARLAERADGVRRVTWSPSPGTLVAVETGEDLTRDELLIIASGVVPTTSSPSIPLELAHAKSDDGREAFALGWIRNGEVCVNTDTECQLVTASEPQPGSVQAAAVYSRPTEFGIQGITTADIAAVRVTGLDGGTGATDIATTPQPVGVTRAFAVVSYSSPVTVIPLDATGNPIANFEMTQVPLPATIPATTIEIVDTPSET